MNHPDNKQSEPDTISADETTKNIRLTGLDELIRKFKGYVLEENDFDELDFKEAIIDWRDEAIRAYIQPHLDQCLEHNGMNRCKNCGLSPLESEN